MNLKTKLAARIQERIAGRVETSTEVCREFSSNFGGLEHRIPALVVWSNSAADLSHILRLARETQTPVSVRGSGHSFNTQGLCDGGILIVNRSRRPELRLLEGFDAEVTAGSSWERLELDLNRLGRAMPVLTNELSVTIGGTLSVGGYGEGTVAHGGQIDQVKRFELIKPDGESVWCSPESNAELFRYGLASLGQLGVIERVVLRTVPYHRNAFIYIERHPTLCALVEASAWMAENGAEESHVDLFSGQHYKGSFVASYGTRAADEAQAQDAERTPLRSRLQRASCEFFRDWPLRSLSEERRNKWSSEHRFIWSDYTVDIARAGRFASFLERKVLTHPAYENYFGRTLMLGMRRPQDKMLFPFEPLNSTMLDLVLGFGLYFRVPRGDERGLRDVQRLQAAILDQCLECGGRPYLSGWYPLDEGLKMRIYGDSLARLRRLKQELDPLNLFNAGTLT